jgi:PadR family transcriptional regulator PadR
MEFDKEMVKGSIVPIVLELLRKQEMYGYEMVKDVARRTEERLEWKEGTLYPCLHRLEADGLVRSRWREAPSGKSRKYYRITRKGVAVLEKRKAEWVEFARAVNVFLLGKA